MNRNGQSVDAETRRGLLYGSAACLSWGLFPLYFRALKSVPALEIAAHRMVGCVVFLAAGSALVGRLPSPRVWIASWRRVAIHGFTAVVLACNWLLYVWAVNAGRTLEASLGYFINPLMNVVLGMLFLGEKLTRWQRVAVALATVGVGVLVVGLGQLPWVPLLIGGTFAIYGLVRKVARMDPLLGLLGESALLMPVALGYIAVLEQSGRGVMSSGTPWIKGLILLAGAITAVPLIWYTAGVRKLPLSTMGLLQYLSPSGQFLVAVGLFGERFTRVHALAFACIWSALMVYTAESFRRSRARAAVAAVPLASQG